MDKVKLFWDPEGQTLNSLGSNSLLRTTDGDTAFVSTAVRMLSIDTPEVHYPGTTNPAKLDAKLKQLADWLQAGSTPAGADLSAYLYPKLASGAAGTLQKQQGTDAATAFQKLLTDKLAKPNGTQRDIYLRAGDQAFDQYGRLLAYMSPQYTSAELQGMTAKDRATFNLMMIDSGWAAAFPIYPSLPKYSDLVLLRDCARDAFEKKRGIWSSPLTLTGYEFRMCYRLWDVSNRLVNGEKLDSQEKRGWLERYCVDMTTQEIYEPENYFRVPVYHRIFVWPADINEAVSRLNLVPA